MEQKNKTDVKSMTLEELQEYFKELDAAENLRQQLKDYSEDSAKIRQELSEAKREIFKLQNKR